VKADPETNAFNITLNFVNEQVIVFDVDPDQQAEFELEVAVQTQNLTAIEVNGVNQTIIFINSVTNKVILDDLITEFKIFYHKMKIHDLLHMVGHWKVILLIISQQ
jgi:hypothetical protein